MALTFKAVDQIEEVDNFKQFYPGLSVLGKNFLVSNVKN